MISRENKEYLDNIIEKNTNENSEDSPQEKKDKLIKDIKGLKKIIFQIEHSFNSFTFGDVHRAVESSKSFHVTGQMINNIINVENKIQSELWRYTGLYSIKMDDDEYIFNFMSSSKQTNNNVYTVQILYHEDRMKIGKWIMPMSVNVHQVLVETPIERLTDLKLFLKNCKHHIDCYTHRMEQYDKIKASLNDVNNCQLFTNSGYTHIRLHLLKVKENDSEQFYNIILYLFYKSGETEPCKLEVESFNKKLSDVTINKLKSYFKYFKLLELEAALEQTISASQAEFLWTKELTENVFIELNDNKEITSESKHKRKRKENSKQIKSKRTKSYKEKIHLDSSNQSEQDDSRNDSLRVSMSEITEKDEDLSREEISQDKVTKKKKKVRNAIKPKKFKKQHNKGVKNKDSGVQKAKDMQSQEKDLNDKLISHSSEPVEQVAHVLEENVLQNVKPGQNEVSLGARKKDNKMMNNSKIPAAKRTSKQGKQSAKDPQNKSKDNLKQMTLNFDVLQDENDGANIVNGTIEPKKKSIRWMDEIIQNQKQSDDSAARLSDTATNKFIISSTPIHKKVRNNLEVPSNISVIKRFSKENVIDLKENGATNAVNEVSAKNYDAEQDLDVTDSKEVECDQVELLKYLKSIKQQITIDRVNARNSNGKSAVCSKKKKSSKKARLQKNI